MPARWLATRNRFEQSEHKNPLLITSHFRDNFPLECALAKARKYKKNTGRLPKGNEFDLLYGFLISARRIHAELPQAAISRFEGALRGALKDSNGLRPFAYEVGIAAHLMRKKWDVEFADLCGTARFDFLARQDDIEIEVECKTTSGDTGRKIHRQEVNRLANLILPTTQQLGNTAGCHLIRVIIPNRLATADRELAEIASTVASAGPQKCSAFIKRLRQSGEISELEFSMAAPPHTPRARSPAVGSIASGFIPPNPFAVSPNEEERSAFDAHARPGLEKRDTVQSMSRGRPAALGSIMSTLEQRRDQMFPKLRPEEIDRTATAAIERLFFVQARYCAILANGPEKNRCSPTEIMAPPRRAHQSFARRF